MLFRVAGLGLFRLQGLKVGSKVQGFGCRFEGEP